MPLNKISFTLCAFFLFYCGQIEAQKSICIVAYNAEKLGPWDPDSVQNGLPGSEEAIVYMSQQLADLGYKVTVLCQPPEGSKYSDPEANPRYYHFDYANGPDFDIAIAWRIPQIAQKLREHADFVYFWPHDTFHWPLPEKQINGFDDVLWLSQWHRQQWISFNSGFTQFTQIFGNGINPEQFNLVQERENPYSCIYGSNYARGLEILLDIWPIVKKEYPKATLDIYYGWQHWGSLKPEKETKMRRQVTELAASGVTDHGLVGHEELNRAYEKASFWTYPCIAPETFCITALRAQMSGAVPVIIEGTALVETVRHGYKCSAQEQYITTLMKAMSEAEKITLKQRQEMSEFILQEYTWQVLADRWSKLFETTAERNKRKSAASFQNLMNASIDIKVKRT